jgi:NADH dehydrogenase FAD-containing subunit
VVQRLHRRRDRAPGDTAVQKALLTFVIVGGGPTGVELAGILPTIPHGESGVTSAM